jgi:acyl-CoA synthetase (AMP-forming)/AMP-acid ligase II
MTARTVMDGNQGNDRSTTNPGGPPRRFFDVPELLRALAELPPDRPALTFYRGRTRAGALHYGELLAATEGVFRRLRDQLGIRAGDAIALLSPNRLEVPPLLLAALRLGAALVPLNPTTSPQDWDYIVTHSRARAIFGTRELLDRLVGRPDIVSAFEDDPGWSAARARTGDGMESTDGDPVGDAMGVVLYTSGTTGNPKGVALRQGSLLANAWSMAVNFGLRGETQFAVLPLYHAHALGFGLMTALTTGGHLVFAERFDPFSWADVIRAERVTLTSVVPTLLPPLLQVGVRRERVPLLRAIMVSSAPLTVALAREFESNTEIPLIQGWGLSEYTNFACCLSPALPDDEHRRRLYGGELTAVGSPLPGTEVKVVGPGGATLPAGARGELAVRGHSTMIGYFRDADATVAALGADGWLRTGDEGFFTLQGDDPVFFIAGRIKETIIRDGDKWSPLAIERQICAKLPELEGKLVVLGFPHQAHGEEVGAYLETDTLAADLEQRLLAAVNALPADQRPKIVLYGAAPIPRTHTGKIQRRKLQAAFAAFKNCRGAARIEAAVAG